MVPSASEWANPVGVSMVISLGLREKKRSVLRRREGRRGMGPVRLKREEMELLTLVDNEGSIIWSLDACCLWCLLLLLSKHDDDDDENSNEDLDVTTDGRR
mmetsp:Transcript_3529/g.5080  ORF Transcript_3529/g.5080 Transcript_3529/m.5080 type:complete len:101 (+) Transcript_3529:968-1270(+)